MGNTLKINTSVGILEAGIINQRQWTAMRMWPRPQQFLGELWSWGGPSDSSQVKSSQPCMWCPLLTLREAWPWVKLAVLAKSFGLPPLPAPGKWSFNWRQEVVPSTVYYHWPQKPSVSYPLIYSVLKASTSFLISFSMSLPKALLVSSMRSLYFPEALLYEPLPFKIFKPRMSQQVTDTSQPDLGISVP